MKRYDYMEGVIKDLLIYIWDTDGLWDVEEGVPAFRERADFVAHMNEVAPNQKAIIRPTEDTLEGDAWWAEDCLAHNLGLLAEACTALHEEPDIARPLKCDTIIRRYVLGTCIEVLADRYYGESA